MIDSYKKLQRISAFARSFKSAHGTICGFTLAEVLITLMIIGVVGALTIPGFIADHQKKVYATSLKNFYSSFNAGMQKYMSETGCVGDLSCTGKFKYSTWNGNEKPLLDSMVTSTFNVDKICGFSTSCIKGPYIFWTSVAGVQSIINNPGWHGDTRAYNYITADGMLVWIYIGDNPVPGCKSTGNSASKATPLCAGVAVDINGNKPPNAAGRDYFVFYLANNGMLYPRGSAEMGKYADGDNWKNSVSYWRKGGTCTTKQPYTQCAARIMEEDWEMTY